MPIFEDRLDHSGVAFSDVSRNKERSRNLEAAVQAEDVRHGGRYTVRGFRHRCDVMKISPVSTDRSGFAVDMSADCDSATRATRPGEARQSVGHKRRIVGGGQIDHRRASLRVGSGHIAAYRNSPALWCALRV